jgi:hypothetical protein
MVVGLRVDDVIARSHPITGANECRPDGRRRSDQEFAPENDQADAHEHGSERPLHEVAGEVLADSGPDRAADEDTGDGPRDDVPDGCRRDGVNDGTGHGGDSEDEHARRDGHARWESTPDDELCRRDFGKPGADESRDEPTDGRQPDAWRPSTRVVAEPFTVGRLDDRFPPARVLSFEELVFLLAGNALFRWVVKAEEGTESEETDAERERQERRRDVVCGECATTTDGTAPRRSYFAVA